MFTGMPGRPKFNIPKEQLGFLIEQHFSTPAVADILGVSRRTVVRRLREFGLSCRAVYSLMSDEQLDKIMLSILAEFPETGYKRMNEWVHFGFRCFPLLSFSWASMRSLTSSSNEMHLAGRSSPSRRAAMLKVEYISLEREPVVE